MNPHGWKGKTTLRSAVDELILEEFIQRTKRGGNGDQATYAVTWRAISEGRLSFEPDVIISSVPSNSWKQNHATALEPPTN